MARQVRKATWDPKESPVPLDSRVIQVLRVSQVPRVPLALQEKRVPWENPASQECPVLTDPRGTLAKKAPLERKEARVHLAPRAHWATLVPEESREQMASEA